MAEAELKNLKEAIIDLYLAIKIRSTEEVSVIENKLVSLPITHLLCSIR